jgi:predicted nucleic acid-binding protein
MRPGSDDNFCTPALQTGEADFLTGDRRDLLSLLRHHRTSIVAARQFLDGVLRGS